MRKSPSVVRTMGSARTSLMRTRQASARLIGTLEYLCISFSTGSVSSPRSKESVTAPRRRRAASPGAPRTPRRWNASDRTASQVLQGGGRRSPCSAAQAWLPSRRLSSATRKPASTRTLLAITRLPEMLLLACAQVGGQSLDRADEIANAVERSAVARSAHADGKTLSDHVGLRQLARSRFSFDL